MVLISWIIIIAKLKAIMGEKLSQNSDPYFQNSICSNHQVKYFSIHSLEGQVWRPGRHPTQPAAVEVRGFHLLLLCIGP